jgi:hypothetical protein
MPKMVPTKQAPSSAKSAKINYAVGSGSRPNGGKLPIQSSAPKSAKNHKG